MRLIDGVEGEILKKYRKGRVIDEEDRHYLERMWNTKLMGSGYDPELDKATAKTTSLGVMGTDYSFMEFIKLYFEYLIDKVRNKYPQKQNI